MLIRGRLLHTPQGAWECPNCDQTYLAPASKTGIPYHPCRGLAGLSAPFVRAGTSAKVERVERGDYVRNDLVQVDANNRPVMAIQTTRDDGTDCAVLAPTAQAIRE